MLVGRPITKAEAEDLKSRVEKCGANEEAFLKFAGATDYESIPADRHEALDTILKKKEKAPEKRNAKGEIECSRSTHVKNWQE